ncbi:MAG: DoxX family protein [Paludibacteraceae bacterium]|nr:DoxX family protein [Paludibacteraceae bacterium]
MHFALPINRKVKIAIVTLCRLFLGVVFIIFGLIRACNPIEGGHIVSDYIAAAGLHFFQPLSTLLAVAFASVEFAIGVGSLLGTNIKKTSLYTALFLLFLTPFSFYTTYVSPVTTTTTLDGPIIKELTSCWVYLFFLWVAIQLFVWRKYSKTIFTNRTEWSIGPTTMAFAVLISAYSYFRLPVIDLTPYRTGLNISKYLASQELTKDDIEWNEDNLFCIKHIEKVSTKKGEQIEALQLYDQKEGDVSKMIIGKEGYTFLLIADDLSDSNTSARHQLNRLYDYARNNGYSFYCLTATNPSSNEAEEYIVESGGAEYPMVNADTKVLRRMIQSKPGLLLLKDGVVYHKWSHFYLPELKDKLENCAEGEMQVESMRMKALHICCVFGLIIIGILALDWFFGLLIWLFRKLTGKAPKEEKKDDAEKAKAPTNEDKKRRKHINFH